METEEPDVTVVAAIRPNKQDGVHDAFENALSLGAAHEPAVALRAFLHFFGEQ